MRILTSILVPPVIRKIFHLLDEKHSLPARGPSDWSASVDHPRHHRLGHCVETGDVAVGEDAHLPRYGTILAKRDTRGGRNPVAPALTLC